MVSTQKHTTLWHIHLETVEILPEQFFLSLFNLNPFEHAQE